MPDPRRVAFFAVTSVVVFGTTYSVLYDTYLDTSNPLVAHLPHPLSATNYWASKSNWINVYFIKKAWGWTTLAFFATWLTSPAPSRSISRLLKWVMATATWLVFTNWFFGPAVFERIILSTGGECMLSLPTGEHISLPHEFCRSGTSIVPSDIPDEVYTSRSLLPPEWKAVPRLRKGHDVSGHLFLLTLSILFLADQLRPSLHVQRWSVQHTVAVIATLALLGIWIFASYTTSVYFHSPFEKITGYFLGMVSFGATQIFS